mgnify:CR=1 FL=1
MTQFPTDTIIAPATSSGGAISIIRVSGPETFAIVDKLVRFRSGSASEAAGYTLKVGAIPDLDDVVVAIYRAPHSYTGEDSAELMCHASTYVVGRLLELLSSAGARLAEPGEFTRRAFAAGKMDLAQAEAVADLIASTTAASHRIAMNQMKGGYSAELSSLRERLVGIASLLELELDFSEEDVEFADRRELSSLLEEVISHVSGLIASFRSGNAIRNGVPVAIVGDVNTGKSTLLNALLGDERAIVSDIPGTTRDTVEETMVIDGVLYRFIDTAGIRDASDKIERIGISRSFEKLAAADLVLVLLDASSPLERLKKSLASILPATSPEQDVLILRNKVDIYDAIAPEQFPTHDRSYGIFELKYPAFGTYDMDPHQLAAALGVRSVHDISARTGEGIPELRSLIADSQKGRFSGEQTLVTNARHLEALNLSLEALTRVKNSLVAGIPGDLVAQDLREALHHIGTITGSVTTDEILGEIFGRFCIGK